MEKTDESQEPRFEASPAAASLERRLSSVEVKRLSTIRATVSTAGFLFPARRRPPPEPAAGLLAMLDDVVPSSCVFRRHGCWPKKKAKKKIGEVRPRSSDWLQTQAR